MSDSKKLTTTAVLRDPLKFPDLNHAVKRDPRTNLRSAKTNWDFWTSLPEALHQITIVMSDRGIPATGAKFLPQARLTRRQRRRREAALDSPLVGVSNKRA